MEELNDENSLHYRLYLPRDPEGNDFVIDAQYADVRMRVAFIATEEGEKDLKDALRTFPKLIDKAHHAQTVRKEMAGLDGELDKLLGEE